jgi:hypothetical protein
LLIKTWITLSLAAKASWNWRFFYGKSVTRKSLLRYFAMHFFFVLKKYLATQSRTFFRFFKKAFNP